MADLNAIRDALKQNQRRGDDLPDDFMKKAFVDPDGEIFLGHDPKARDGRPRSEIHQGVFAASGGSRLEDERAIVDEYLPVGTEQLDLDGTTGWVYDFPDGCGRWWQMFLYHDGSLYQVQVVYPVLEGEGFGVHDAHLFSDGRICLSHLGGLPDLQQAYAKSVVWANGFSIFQESGQFPFSINND